MPAKLMPGTGACSLADAIVLTEHAVELGCGGVLMLPPFYYKAPSEEGLFRFFAEVIEERRRRQAEGLSLPHPAGGAGRLLAAADRPPDQGVSRHRRGPQGLLRRLEQHRGDPRRPIRASRCSRARRSSCSTACARAAPAASRRPATSAPRPSATSTTTGRAADADKLQAGITALRKAIQAFPMIPALKALIAHYRQDAGWAKVRAAVHGAARRGSREGRSARWPTRTASSSSSPRRRSAARYGAFFRRWRPRGMCRAALLHLAS